MLDLMFATDDTLEQGCVVIIEHQFEARAKAEMAEQLAGMSELELEEEDSGEEELGSEEEQAQRLREQRQGNAERRHMRMGSRSSWTV